MSVATATRRSYTYTNARKFLFTSKTGFITTSANASHHSPFLSPHLRQRPFSSSSTFPTNVRHLLPTPHESQVLSSPRRRLSTPSLQGCCFSSSCTSSTPASVSSYTMGSISPQSAPVRIFIAGGSYAGLSTAMNLLDMASGANPRMAGEDFAHVPNFERMDIEITIADERDGFYHLIGSPLALADSEYSKKAWVKFQDIPSLQHPNVKIVIGSVTSVDCATKTATTLDTVTKIATEHNYDYFVAASGLRRPWPVVPQSLSRKQFLVEAAEHIHAVSNAQHGVVVVGGGAVGIEMASELKVVHPHIEVTLAHSRDKLLSAEALSDECKDTALELLRECGVNVLMSHRLSKSERVDTNDGSIKYDLEFTNGHKMTASDVIMAVSQPTSTATYLPASALNENNLVKISASLNFVEGTPNAEYHFCAGDAAKWSGIKRCGGAMHGGHYVARNIHQTILRDSAPSHEIKYCELSEFPAVIGLAVGKKAVASSPDNGTVSGEDVMKAYFRNDLGFDICWEYMQLGGKKDTVVEA